MTSRKPLLSVEDAVQQITQAMPEMRPETIALENGLGRVLANDIHARVSHPPHDVSAMDGYAVALADLDATDTLTVIGESAAGHPFDAAIKPSTAIRIFTGAHLPPGADAIVIQEDTQPADGNTVTILEKPSPNRYIRPKGQDFAEGDRIAAKGQALNARRLALIASAGHGRISVKTKPTVAILSTGDELVSPGTMPDHGQIIASNGMFLDHFLKVMGAEPLNLGQIPDDPEALTQAFTKAQAADLIVTTGGASVGHHDGVAQHMTQGQGLGFWRIAMRPGKPLIFGHLGKTPMLGLPGNPVSTGVCAMVFVQAALRQMLGQSPAPQYHTAKLSHELSENDLRQDYLRATLTYDDHGQRWVHAFNKQDSGMFQSFADADALIMRPPHAPPARKGDRVEILPLPALI